MSQGLVRVAPLTGLAGVMILLGGCGVDRQQAIDDLVGAGYEPESADCIMDALESQGYEAGDLEDPLAPEVEDAIGVAVEQCLTPADLDGLSSDVEEDQLRIDVLDELVSSGMEPAMAECIVDHLVDAGFTMIDLARAGLEAQAAGGVVDAVQAAADECGAE